MSKFFLAKNGSGQGFDNSKVGQLMSALRRARRYFQLLDMIAVYCLITLLNHNFCKLYSFNLYQVILLYLLYRLNLPFLLVGKFYLVSGFAYKFLIVNCFLSKLSMKKV